MQAESYKSTISHELRTPLGSSSVILKHIIRLISSKIVSLADLVEAKKSASLILAQLHLMESFVEDLLNLRLLREGIMTISKEQFDLKDALDFIVSIFEIKSSAKGVNLFYSAHQNLIIPSESTIFCFID